LDTIFASNSSLVGKKRTETFHEKKKRGERKKHPIQRTLHLSGCAPAREEEDRKGVRGVPGHHPEHMASFSGIGRKKTRDVPKEKRSSVSVKVSLSEKRKEDTESRVLAA